MHFFLATGGEKTEQPSLDDNEDIEVQLLTLEEMKQLLRDNTIIQSMHVTALFYALEKLGEIRY